MEEFISGHEVEVAVLGNKNPIASVVGEMIAGAEFYDYDAKVHLHGVPHRDSRGYLSRRMPSGFGRRQSPSMRRWAARA